MKNAEWQNGVTHMNIFARINELLDYAEKNGLIEKEDRTYSRNLLIDALHLDGFEEAPADQNAEIEDILRDILDYAYENGIIPDNGVTQRDLFDARIMGLLTPRPSEVIGKFKKLYAEDPVKATDWYYAFSCATDYIRTYRVKKDLRWKAPSVYGDIDITINLSKPEKDPKAIAAAKALPQSGYPKCALCAENEGYAGNLRSAARENHRIIPMTLADEAWFLQYSPYVYYNEHCIVLSADHIPMKIETNTFARLLDFVGQYPHYFVGSNADLPIVGGSILSHDHMQGGNYTFAMAKAPIFQSICFKGYDDVDAGLVEWPMSVIRLRSTNKASLVDLADKILGAWRGYTDADAFVFAETDGEPHNTITPIARMRDGKYELDLVLRNNITTEEHPLGVYHPHADVHHIKKENIGLIEVMGLAVLPARLRDEIDLMCEYNAEGRDFVENSDIEKHKDWYESIKDKYTFTKENTEGILKEEIGAVFQRVLEDAGVYKRTPDGEAAFLKFIEHVNNK